MKRMQEWESLVLTGTEWSTLRYHDIVPDTLHMFTIALDGSGYRDFVCGKDYEIDCKTGRIRRLPGSEIGDYSNSPFFGKTIFDHGIYNGNWGSYPFMVYVSYVYETETNRLIEDEARHITLDGNLPRLAGGKTLERLLKGETVRYLVYGDSISTGCEAIYEQHTYFHRFADRLERVTGGKVEIINKAVGGENSRGGLARFQQVLEEAKPHLVSIAYGVNDMCVHGDQSDDQNAPSEVSREEFRGNIVAMLTAARGAGAEVVLITNCIPNPCWKFTSKRAGDYPEEMRGIAREYQVPLADNWRLWERELATGKTLHDLQLNDINHPTSYGHELYAQMLYTLL